MQEKFPSSAIPILGLLHWKPMTGYDLKKSIDESIGNFWHESPGQLYPQLKKLAEAGLISLIEEKQTSARKTKTYAINDSGRKLFCDWISKTPKIRQRRNELLLKIFFVQDNNLDFVREHIMNERERLFKELQHLRAIQAMLKRLQQQQDYPLHQHVRFWLLTVSFGIKHAQAFLGWCDEALDELASTSTIRENISC